MNFQTKNLIFLCVTLIAISVFMCFAGCSDSEPPKSTKSPHTKVTTNDSNLPVDLVTSWGNQKEFFIKKGFEILGWNAAKSELLKRDYRGGKQYHTGWLTIYMNDGRKYLTKQPEIDVFFEFMSESKLSTKGFGTE